MSWSAWLQFAEVTSRDGLSPIHTFVSRTKSGAFGRGCYRRYNVRYPMVVPSLRLDSTPRAVCLSRFGHLSDATGLSIKSTTCAQSTLNRQMALSGVSEAPPSASNDKLQKLPWPSNPREFFLCTRVSAKPTTTLPTRCSWRLQLQAAIGFV